MESAGIISGLFPDYLVSFVDELDEHPWLFASLASILVGLSGILPLFIIPIDETASFKDGSGAATLRILLSFAVGGLLGDVFLHLLPEAWQHDFASTKEGEHMSMKCGLWCLFGMLVFIIVEKLFAASEGEEEPQQNGSIRQIEIEEIDKLLAEERRHRGKSESEGICGGNGAVTAKQLYDTCVFNNNTKGEGGCCSADPVANGSPARCGKGNRWMGRCLLREAREKALTAAKEKPERKDVSPNNIRRRGRVLQRGPCGQRVPGALREGEPLDGALSAAGGPGEGPHCRQGEAGEERREGGCCSADPVANGSPARCGKGNRWMGRCLLREAREKALTAAKEKPERKDVAGYLNLMANSIDNFTHGLAVGGSFLVGFRVGLLTTFAILVHEIPHEVGDFAILLKSGFSRWEAAKAQLATASAGLIGALTAVIFSGARNAIEAKTSWIVPFTAGGFLHIALVTVLPDLLREEDKWESLKHLAALVAGIGVMAFMTHYFG